MSQYILVYFGGNPPSTPEEGEKHFKKYKSWLQSLGESSVSPANPLKNKHSIRPDNSVIEGGDSGMSGYTIIQAESMEEALKIGEACPFLEIGGTLEVSELGQMPF